MVSGLVMDWILDNVLLLELVEAAVVDIRRSRD